MQRHTVAGITPVVDSSTKYGATLINEIKMKHYETQEE